MKTYIIEEHNEAFYVWNHARQNRLIKETNNILLHVDEHADNIPPQLNLSMHDLDRDMEQLKNFTYGELNIASFIVPAFYQGIFNCIYWVRQSATQSTQSQDRAENEGDPQPPKRRSYRRVV